MFRLVVLCWSGCLLASASGQGLGSLGRGGTDPAASLMSQAEGSFAEPRLVVLGSGREQHMALINMKGMLLFSASSEILGDLQTDPRVHDMDTDRVSL